MKQCNRCKEFKSPEYFHANKLLADGLARTCKQCAKTKSNKHYEKIKGSKHEKRRVSRINSSKRTKDKVSKWKEEQGCYICGETFSRCLELHHLDPTQKEYIPSQIAGGNWEKFLKEANKCLVLCANCHRKVHGDFLSIVTTQTPPTYAG